MKIFFVSLGCDKNLVDSEVMLEQLHNRGYSFTDDEEEADIAVVNSCCFIGDAKEESIRTIIELGGRKQTGKLQKLILCGCLAQRYHQEILEELPEVDAVVGTLAIERIVDAVEACLAGKREIYLEDIQSPPFIGRKRVNTTGGYYAFLKIAEGCDKHCTYCVIPKVRGNFRSVPMEDLLAQARELAAQGIRELILVAQETTVYGIDLYGAKQLPELLHRLCEIEGIRWIRLLYCYPEEITEELIDTIRDEEKIVHYIDMPIQHASDRILSRMGRKTNQEEIRRKVAMIRGKIPDIALRTTLITGFPGETEADFEELYRFVNEMEFDRLGVFPYSAEEDTPAASMPDQIDEKVKQSRRDEIMELQQAIAFENEENMVGRLLPVMIEGRIAEDNVYVARSYRDAPDVDGYVFVNTDRDLMSGDFVTVRITDSREYDLIGEMEDEFTQ
ncbi:MAG: 30S ribosomal protein S12 methylthiotransferase RimO [Lachnospiraceae bacterium]